MQQFMIPVHIREVDIHNMLLNGCDTTIFKCRLLQHSYVKSMMPSRDVVIVLWYVWKLDSKVLESDTTLIISPLDQVMVCTNTTRIPSGFHNWKVSNEWSISGFLINELTESTRFAICRALITTVGTLLLNFWYCWERGTTLWLTEYIYFLTPAIFTISNNTTPILLRVVCLFASCILLYKTPYNILPSMHSYAIILTRSKYEKLIEPTCVCTRLSIQFLHPRRHSNKMLALTLTCLKSLTRIHSRINSPFAVWRGT